MEDARTVLRSIIRRTCDEHVPRLVAARERLFCADAVVASNLIDLTVRLEPVSSSGADEDEFPFGNFSSGAETAIETASNELRQYCSILIP